jgi:hypothetical protein
MCAVAIAAPVFERPVDRADEWHVAKGAIRLLDLPPHRFVMIDGVGPPLETEFAVRMPGLYTTAYGLHFTLRKRGVQAPIGPLEGLWWTVDAEFGLDDILSGDRGGWRWTLLMGVPDEATEAEIGIALEAGRGKLAESFASNLRIEAFDEGRVAQVLHVGAYSAERATIERLHAAIDEAGLAPRGRHHELYMGDPRRSAPDKLRTILRQPVA